MPKVTLEGYIIVPDSDLIVVVRELANHIKLTRQEEGCMFFNVSQDDENINRFNVYEEFHSQSAFELHQQRVINSKWGKITVNVERHYQISGSG
ncbi:MAG: antibiotic biosynthesis monooxygenase [Cycloclasticus sp.]|nr:antibiotic biosynthesis monooxygenase [Cycloclasticus sp.]